MPEPSGSGYVPVYLPDRTVVGRARISDDGAHIEIDIEDGTPVAELFRDNIGGLSVMYLNNEARDRVTAAREKENHDDRSE